MYIHWVACALHLLTVDVQTWMPPTDFMYGGTTLYEEDIIWRYGSVMYHAVISFALVEICPRSNSDLVGCVIIFLINAIVNANLFGFFAELL